MSVVTILQVVPRLDTGGSEQATVEIAEALTRAGANALVATAGGRLAASVIRAGGEVINLPAASKNPFTIFANAARIARIVNERNVALVHARSRAPGWSAFLAARRTGRPFVTTYHGAYGSFGPVKAAYNSVMSRGDRIIANSLYTARLIAEREPAVRERIRVIYRGIDSATFDPLVVPPGPVAKLRERWGVKPGTKIVLHAARLTGLKGHRHTVEAAAKLASQGLLDGAAVVFAGDWPGKDYYRQELIELISKYGLDGKVLIVGHCEDMPAAFLAAHVAILPSLVAETFGRTSVEAQAMGCPVIVSNLGALPETVEDADAAPSRFTGWLVPAGDSEALAAKIALALKLTPEERAAIGARAQARACALFELSQMQAKTLQVYDELLGTDLARRFADPPALRDAAAIADGA
jgi:glycosyltransferase involved in cell wall biosynthesis